MKWAAFLLLLVQAWNALGLIPRFSATRNECAHIPAGLLCWYFERFDLYHVNPPLPRLLATAPLLTHSDISLDLANRVPRDSPRRLEFDLARFFADTNPLNYHSIVCRARLAGVVWLAGGGVLLWHWASAMFGRAAGLMALALWTCEPMLNSHAALATSDLPATVAGAAVGYMWWRFTRSASLIDAATCGIALGVALLTKYTHLAWLPLGVALFFVAITDKACALRGLGWRRHLARLVTTGAIAWVVLWAGYSFRGFGEPFGSLTFRSKMFGGLFGKTCALTGPLVGVLPTPVPPDYLRGLDSQQRDFEGGQQSYLRGEWRSRGWWYFYLYGLAVKLPLGLLGAIALAVPVWMRDGSRIPRAVSALVWLPPAAILALASIKSGFTQHVRYVLPALPFLILGVSRLGQVIRGYPTLLTSGTAWLLVGASAASAAWNYPNWLGYFNELAGGPMNGWRHLADSNVDWGQDLIGLKRWLDDHPDARPISLAYNNYYDYVIYTRERFDQPAPARSGYVAIDAASLTEPRYAWLRSHAPIARIGTSILVLKNP